MAELIRYLLLVNILMVLFSIFYRLFIANGYWLKINRIVILAGIALSFIIPLFRFDFLPSTNHALIVIPEALISSQTFQPDIYLDEIQIYGTAPTVFPWLSILQGLYFIGIISMLILFLSRINNILTLQKLHPMKWFNKLYITVLPPGSPSFSFLDTVYYSGPIISDDAKTKLILEHERVHITQKHSWDLIFVEIIQLFLFYNPSIYSLKRQLILNHEYLADKIVARTDRNRYSLALFQAFFNAPNFALSHSFNHSSTLKKRFIMLHRNTQNRWVALKYMLIIPMLVLFMAISAFTTVNAQEKKSKEEVAKEAVEVNLKEAGFSQHDIKEIQKRIDQPGTDKAKKGWSSHNTELAIIKNKACKETSQHGDVFYIVEDMPSFDGKGLEHFRNWIQSNVKYPELAKEKKISGTVYTSFVINKEGKIESIKIVRGVHKLLDDEVIRVLKSAPAWIPGKQRGKNVKVSFAIPVRFNLS